MDEIILNKSEYIEAYSHLKKIEKAIREKDKFKLAILLTQLKYKYDLRLEVIESEMLASSTTTEGRL